MTPLSMSTEAVCSFTGASNNLQLVITSRCDIICSSIIGLKNICNQNDNDLVISPHRVLTQKVLGLMIWAYGILFLEHIKWPSQKKAGKRD